MRRSLVYFFAVLTILIAPMQAFPQELSEILKSQEIIGNFGNWMVNKGITYNGTKYCAATSLTIGSGGRVSLRVLPNSSGSLEWQVIPSATVSGEGLSDVEARRVLIAEFAPSFTNRPEDLTIQAMVSIGTQSWFPVKFTIVKAGSNSTLQNRYWWLVEIDSLDGFARAASWITKIIEMHITFPNTKISDVDVSMLGFPGALEALNRCSVDLK